MNELYGNTYGFSSSNMMFGGLNSFGMNSIFTDCNGNPNFDSMAGFAVGSTLINYALMAISSSVQYNRQNKKPEANVAEDISNIQKLLDAELNKLDVKSPEEAANYTIESEYTDAVNDAEKNFNEARSKITTLDSQITALRAERNSLDTTASDYNNKKDLLEIRIKEAEEEKKELENKVEKGGELYEAKETAKKAKEAREKEIKEIKAKIADYADKLNGAQEKLNEQILDNADGKKKKDRTTWNDELVSTKFDNNNLNVNQTVTIEDIQGAIYAYRVSSTPEEQVKYAEIFNKCWDNMDINDRTPVIRAARTVIPDKDEVKKLKEELQANV